MKFTNFLPLPKTPRLKTLGRWKKAVNALSLLMKNLKHPKLTGNKQKKEITESKEDLASLKEEFIEAEKTSDHREQYSGRNCLKVFVWWFKKQKKFLIYTFQIKLDLI